MAKTIILSTNDHTLLDEFIDPLTKFGYHIDVCHDGETALEIVKKIKPAAVISDLSLPKINGIELCWLIREQDNQTWLPFLILSPIDDKETRLNCYRSGVDDIFILPVTIREFVIRVEILIKRRLRMSRIIDKKTTAFLGSISEFYLSDLMQWLHHNKKTGQLWLTKSYQRGSIYFERGDIKNARLADQNGEKAVFDMLTWRKGSFEFEIGKMSLHENIHKTTDELLLEYNRKMDEDHFQLMHPSPATKSNQNKS